MMKNIIITMGVLAAMTVGSALGPPPVSALTTQEVLDTARATGVPDFNNTFNYANSPILRKFVDGLPGLCGPFPTGYDAAGNITSSTVLNQQNNLGQCLPIAEPDQTTYPGSDYYEIDVVQYREQMHSDLPEVVGTDPINAVSGGTMQRGYRQANTGGPANEPHSLGPIIIAHKDRPVRIKLNNMLPVDDAGKLFIPVDRTVMGAGPGPNFDRTADPRAEDVVCQDQPELCYSDNRATVHLHGGRSPWISDGTAHQWITPEGETTAYPKGASVAYVPDMWFYADGTTVGSCAGQNSCAETGATNNPGPGSQTYYYTNAQSARMMFYHDHSWGITRLNVYVGEVAGYFVTDETEKYLVDNNFIPGPLNTIPLIIQDKTYVDADTIVDMVTRDAAGVEISRLPNAGTDPTWVWGSKPGAGEYGLAFNNWSTGAQPVTGDLWWPHVYMPAQNPFNPDLTGIAPYGRWHYGPWFWPPTDVPFGPIANPYYDGVGGEQALLGQPPQIPSTPNPSWGAEAFFDTPTVNGTAYPVLEVQPDKYRFRILNGAHDRFWNLQFYVADSTVPVPLDCKGTGCVPNTEVAMVPAVTTPGFPELWPADNREGGVPNPETRGPAIVQIGTEGGFLPKPVVLPNQPVNWNVDVTTFTAGLVLQQNEGGGTLMMGPAERADIVVDFSKFAGKTLILYNDAPAPWPALDPHYDYFTGGPDMREAGGANTTLAGRGPNTRTIMQIKVAAGADSSAPNDDYDQTWFDTLLAQFIHKDGVFATGQEPLIVGQSVYNDNYDITFPGTWPNWGLARITDDYLSWQTPDGGLVSNYPIEPKAIQDEMGEVFDEYGRMSAKLGLELAHTTAGIQTFVLQNFIDPPTEIVAKDQVQIWKITHNGVDTHPVHFHMFEVQLLNRVGWDGFIYLPDDNERGWKEVVRISPLEDTIVALRPAKVPTPFSVPNSIRPLNPAYPLGKPAGFTNLDPKTAQALTEPIVNQMFNFGAEYLWHCHILSHEEQDMMRVLVLNQNQLVYTDNDTGGFWQWNRGDWSQISGTDPDSYVTSGTHAFVGTTSGVYSWNGYNWAKITGRVPGKMVAFGPNLYAEFSPGGLFRWDGTDWTRLTTSLPSSMAVSELGFFGAFSSGTYKLNTTGWQRLTTRVPTSLAASETMLLADFSIGLYKWDGTWAKLNNAHVDKIVAHGPDVYAKFTGYTGLYGYDGTTWQKLANLTPTAFDASRSALYADFTGYGASDGLYEYANNAWKRISVVSPHDFDASESILYANFTGEGVKKWEFGAWSLLNGAPTPNPSTLSAGY